ncbi:MAG: hypothetical protein E7634_04455 [Ruminococcaceae bacterium]|nr:hypothetical protein [Oscillospiraceae bacterium]
MPNIKADLSSEARGVIRPLHGVNSGPMTKVFTYDARPQFLEAGFPFARLHDVEYPYGSGEFVDIPCIFKDFDADETCPESYNFGLTDEYIRRCIEVGAEPIFRLGVSIEHAPVKRYVYPPKDFNKWARICEHIIRHYNEGWANGYEWNIRYFEIWNEADNCLRGGTNMWLGTPEQFFELYRVSATHLKKCFPRLKIGGCAFTRAESEFMERFFEYLNDRKEEGERVPLDFYSWHLYYSDIEKMVEEADKARRLTDRYGYGDTENIFDEWNYMRDWSDQSDSYVTLKSHVGAAFCGASLCAMQTRTDIDAAAYFEADVVKEWCGIFEVDEMSIGSKKATVKPLKPFYAFKAFNELYKLGYEKRVFCDTENIYACAASDGKRWGMLISNYNGGDMELEIGLSGLPKGAVELRITDEERDFEKLALGNKERLSLTLPIKNNSLVYIGSPC